MEKKLANMELNDEELNEVSGGIIFDVDPLGMGNNSMANKSYHFDISSKLIDYQRMGLGADAMAAELNLDLDMEKNGIH